MQGRRERNSCCDPQSIIMKLWMGSSEGNGLNSTRAASFDESNKKS
jgi:hypothetical protein